MKRLLTDISQETMFNDVIRPMRSRLGTNNFKAATSDGNQPVPSFATGMQQQMQAGFGTNLRNMLGAEDSQVYSQLKSRQNSLDEFWLFKDDMGGPMKQMNQTWKEADYLRAQFAPMYADPTEQEAITSQIASKNSNNQSEYPQLRLFPQGIEEDGNMNDLELTHQLEQSTQFAEESDKNLNLQSEKTSLKPKKPRQKKLKKIIITLNKQTSTLSLSSNNQSSIHNKARQLKRQDTDKFIGTLSVNERYEKVLKFLKKKRERNLSNKYSYKCRQQVADKRLRIKGRFVTKKQAFAILGLTQNELKSNEIIQKLLESHYVKLNSLVESFDGQKHIKIRNFQALIDDNYERNVCLQNGDIMHPYQSIMGPDYQANHADDNGQSINLNLRISKGITEKQTDVMVSNYTDYEQIMRDKDISSRMSVLQLRSLIQPLFKIEKAISSS